MTSKYKNKEFVLLLYIGSILIFCFYKLVEIIVEFNRQSQVIKNVDSTELEWGYLAIFVVLCFIIYEFLMFAWALVLLKEINKKDRSTLTFYILLFTSSIPVLLLIRLYFLQYG